MSPRSRYGRNICFVSVPFYFFAITLFLTITLLHSFRVVHATIAQSFHANVGRMVACVSRVSWHNEHVTESQNGGRRVVCARIFVKRSVMKATPAISRRYFRIALFKTNEENRAAFVAMKTLKQCLFLQRNWNEVSMERIAIRSVTKSFNCSHASLSIGKWNKILTFWYVYSVFRIYKSESTSTFVIYTRMKIYSWN